MYKIEFFVLQTNSHKLVGNYNILLCKQSDKVKRVGNSKKDCFCVGKNK